ncbi:MAG: hypothetical protein LBI05_10280 [Planctomycetaceae bacterium]|jgi:hypothetical protein|nr:hypothetical protein [Planctomycetaceae bacterium]
MLSGEQSARTLQMAEALSQSPSGASVSTTQWQNQPSSTRVTNIQISFGGRGGYNRYWTPGWYSRYPVAWNPYWIPSHRWWYRPSWDYAWGWLAGRLAYRILDPPVYYPYYYGTNVVYRDRIVYINDKEYVPAEEYYNQARQLAHVATVSEETSKSEDDWLTLGTFAVFEQDSKSDTGLKETGYVFQLAANDAGHILGNIVDEANEKVWQVAGSVELETQRVALSLDGDDELVYECGLWNLTQDTAPMLVHVGADEQTNWTLVRLTDSKEE